MKGPILVGNAIPTLYSPEETCYDHQSHGHQNQNHIRLRPVMIFMIFPHQVTAIKHVGPFTHPTDNLVTISAEEQQCLVSNLPSSAGSSSIARLAQTGHSIACVASFLTSTPQVIDSGVPDHLIGTFTLFSDRQFVGKPSRITLANGSTTEITSLGFASLTSSLTVERGGTYYFADDIHPQSLVSTYQHHCHWVINLVRI